MAPNAERVAVLGPPGVGRSSLLAALAATAPGAALAWEEGEPNPPGPPSLKGKGGDQTGNVSDVSTTSSSGSPPFPLREGGPGGLGSDPAALVIVHDATTFADPLAAREPLTELADRLTQWQIDRGRALLPGAWPVFLVLNRADRLARLDDTFTTWHERAAKLPVRVEATLAALLDERGKGEPTGFGSVALRVQLVTLRRPEVADAPPWQEEGQGVAELARDVAAAAQDYARRRATQEPRLKLVFGTAAAGMTLMLLALLVWVAIGHRPPPPSPEAERVELAARARRVLTAARRLQHFDGYRTPGGTTWSGWLGDALPVLDGLDALKRAFDEGQDLGQALRAERDAAAAGLGAQRAWITAFGLAGGEGPLAVPDLQEPWPFEELRKQAERRRVGLAIPPLPDETPVGVARELRAIAAEARRRWLAPVRAELRRRVEALGMGRETPAAWKRLLTEYLGPQARNDLADWLAVDATLRHLAGQPPGDPLNQLVRFLRRDKWALPLEGVALELPAAVKTAGGDHHLQADPDHPLQIRRRTAAGEETKIFLIVVAARDGDRYRLSLAPNTPLAQGALPFEPGDRLSAQIQVYSREGQWLLTWPDTESPSAVYGFAALTRPPRLHPFTETDPIKGEVAFGVRLVFPEPEAWQLPELLE